jgi:hypothetical protein
LLSGGIPPSQGLHFFSVRLAVVIVLTSVAAVHHISLLVIRCAAASAGVYLANSIDKFNLQEIT